MRQQPKRAALIDNLSARRARLYELLVSAGLEVVVDGPHGIDTIAASTRNAVDLVFVSFEEPLPRPIQTVEEVSEAAPDATIVAFSDEATTHAYRKALSAGAKFLIDTPASANEMSAIVDTIAPAAPRQARETGNVIVVAGQKGGVGKTTISVNLASALARDNHGSVLLVDLDPDFGDAGLLLDLNTSVSAARAARDQERFDFESFRSSLSLHESGAYLLGAPQNFAERLATNPGDIQSLIAFASRAFDFVLIDTPCMLNETVAAALVAADVTLVTTTLEFSSLRNTMLMLSEIAAEGVRPERTVLVANNIDPLSGFSVGDAAEILERASIWEVPYDRAMPKSTQLGTPLALSRPNSAASRSLRALAGRLNEDPARIDRRVVVRGDPVAPAEIRERLLSVVRRSIAPAPVFVFSTGRRATTYHAAGCSVGGRLSSAESAPLSELPAHLKPCRLCLGEAAA